MLSRSGLTPLKCHAFFSIQTVEHVVPSFCFSFADSPPSSIKMENLKLQEEINQLKALGQHYEKQLKMAGIEMSDFSDDDMALLDKCVAFGAHTHVHDLHLNYLRDFYCARKKDSIENKLIKAEKQIELRRIKADIEEATRDVAVLERYKAAAEERLIPNSVLIQQTSQPLAIKQGLLDRQKALNIPKDFNIESIIEKVDSLGGR